jgi:SWI/SNF-related matrix-associated actin-dependent regulator 1 of chromatin subfamily A
MTNTASAPTLSWDHLLPEGIALKDFQTVGVAYATVAKRVLIGDEMGLGKTIQALTTLEANDAYPAVVVCPTTLRGNWANEVAKFFPHRTVEIVAGTRAYRTQGADITIVGEAVVKHWADELAQPVALVLDESHYFKTPTAQRTKAVQALADSVPAEGFVIALTGTPIQNRPIELLAQLRILGALEDIVADEYQGKRDPEFAFKFAFCRNEQRKAETGKYTWDGAVDTDRLNALLRGTVMVRRERQEVLGLNDTLRVPVRLTLNGALKTYRAAEADIISHCEAVAAAEAALEAAQKGDDPEAAAQVAALQARLAVMRAEVLVSLTTLRNLVGEAKVEATVEWVENFFASNPGRKLVVFAWHKSVQQALVEALAEYNPAQILGGQADVEDQKARFMTDDTCRVIVCSIKAAAEGHTLTAAQDVLFVEQPWHPGAEQQCEDRVNRIGQEASQVFAWKILADETIDEWVHEIIEAKREVYRSTIIGEAVEADDEASIGSALIARFAGQAAA